MNITELKQALPIILNNSDLTPLIVGHHGMGKSQVIKQYCDENSMGFIDLRLGTQDVGDLLGLPDFKKDATGNSVATKFVLPDWFPTRGKGIIFLDEINRARKDVLQVVFQLALDKKLHTHTLPKGWTVVAACNPDTDDYSVTDMQDKALMDRFAYIKFQPSVEEWSTYAKTQPSVDKSVVAFFETMPELLDGKNADFSLDFVAPSRRSAMNLGKIRLATDDDQLFEKISYGIVGVPTTLAYVQYAAKQLVDFDVRDFMVDFEKSSVAFKELIKNERMDVVNKAATQLLEIINEFAVKENFELLNNVIALFPKELIFRIMDSISLNSANIDPKILYKVCSDDSLLESIMDLLEEANKKETA